MNRKIIYLLNPISGTGNKKAIRNLIDKKNKAKNIAFSILDTTADGDYEYLKEKIRTENITDIVMCGGDGTVNQVLASIYNCEVNFGILPLGSGNGLARGAKIPMKVSAAIELILSGAKAQPTDAFRINNKFGCMLTGLGFDAMVAHDFAGRKVRGFLTYVVRSFLLFFSCKPFPLKIKSPALNIDTNAYFISIANSNQFGNEVTIAPKASLNDGLLDIVVVNKMNKLSMIFRLLWQIRAGKITSSNISYKNKGICYFHTDELVIENSGNAPLHIDGEPAETSKQIEIRVIRDAFRLIRP